MVIASLPHAATCCLMLPQCFRAFRPITSNLHGICWIPASPVSDRVETWAHNRRNPIRLSYLVLTFCVFCAHRNEDSYNKKMVKPKATACSILDLAIISDVLGQAWQFRHTAMSSSVSPCAALLSQPSNVWTLHWHIGQTTDPAHSRQCAQNRSRRLVVLAGFVAMPEFQRWPDRKVWKELQPCLLTSSPQILSHTPKT